ATSSADCAAKPLKLQTFNLAYDNFLGRLAIGRVYEGVVKAGQQVIVKKADGSSRNAKLTKVLTFKGLERVDVAEAGAGDIVIIAGIEDAFIGETIVSDASVEPMPAIAIDEP